MSSTRAILPVCLLILTLTLTLLALQQPAHAASADWEDAIDITFPVTGSNHRYIDDYHQSRSRGAHGATDIMAPYGTPIVAAESGRITWMSTPATSGCGYCLDIRDRFGRTHGYIHMGPKASGRNADAFARNWQTGDTVQRGQVIAYVGCSGNASCGGGEHLHYFIEDPGVTDPYGDHRRNPYKSLRAAEQAANCDPSPKTPFSDVCSTNVHAGDIGRLAAENLTSGCGGDRFCPGEAVTREQMASFLIRALELSGRDSLPFRDVTKSNVHWRTIARLEAEAVTRGCGSDIYCPKRPVTREQMASFLTRALNLTPRSSPTFSDVGRSNVHRNDIAAIANAGITKGCGGDRFCPDRYVTRAQMASFLVRAFVD